MRNTIVFSCFAAATLALFACSETPDAEYPANGPGYPPANTGGAGAGGMSGTGGGGATTPGTGGGPTQDPNATPISPALAAMAQPALDAMAHDRIQGKADGSSTAAQFRAGQIHEVPMTFQPGKCYSAIAVGAGPSEVDVEFVVQGAPFPEYVAAVDNDQGAQAVIGESGSCFKNALPVAVPAKMRIRAVAGDGIVLAQLYSR